MSAIPVAAFEIRCDHCGTQFEDGDYTIFVDAEDGLHDARWIIDRAPDGTEVHVCGGCANEAGVCISPDYCQPDDPCSFTCENIYESAVSS